MKRYRLVNKQRFYSFISLMLISIISLIVLLNNENAQGDNIIKYDVVIVQSGDTIWDIAERYNDKHEDLREFVYIIQKENKINGNLLIQNQTLKIPKSI